MKNKGVIHGKRLKMFYEGKPNLDNFKQFRAEQADKTLLNTDAQTDTQIKDAIVPPQTDTQIKDSIVPPQTDTQIKNAMVPPSLTEVYKQIHSHSHCPPRH